MPLKIKFLPRDENVAEKLKRAVIEGETGESREVMVW